MRLDLRSDRSQIPVLVGLHDHAALAMSLLDPRIPSAAGQAFVRALSGRLRAAGPLLGWLRRLQALAEQLASKTVDPDPTLAGLVASWQAWPDREPDPRVSVDPLPGIEAWSDSGSTSRAAAASLALHRFARAESLEGLAAWAALGKVGPAPSFTELHLDVVALGVLGRRSEATEVLARAQRLCVDAEQWLVVARAYEALDQIDDAVRAHEQVVAIRGGGWDRIRIARARGDLAPGEALPRPDADANEVERVSFVRELAKILEAAGRYDDALVVLGELVDTLAAATPIELVVRAAQLHLWRKETELARARIAAVPNAASDPKAKVVLAAAELLEGRPELALERLEAVTDAGPAELERLAWVAEANVGLGRYEAALEAADQHIVRENSLVAYLLKLLIMLEVEPQTEATLQRWFGSRTFFDALLVDVLPTLRSPEQLAAARTDSYAFARLVQGILDDMGGNRGPTPTWCRRGDDGAAWLEVVAVRPSGRGAAVANLVRIRTEPPERVLAGFDPVMVAYPNSPHPCTYKGELLIWLGRYSEALASFDAADKRAPTRWAFVGRAAAYDLMGEAGLADRWTARGARRFGEIATATTHVYRGSGCASSRIGRRREPTSSSPWRSRPSGSARASTSRSCTSRSARTSGWPSRIAQLRTDAPAFCWEVGDRPGGLVDAAMLLAMLERMVGNRSSFLHTMIDADGQFRVVPEPIRWIGHARLSLHQAREELGRELGARWLALAD